MKKIIFALMVALMSVMASTPASAKTDKKQRVQDMVPASIVVKQTTQFTDGRTLPIYYKKEGAQCEVYSPCNADDYDVTDAQKIKSTNFEVVNKVEGKLYRKASLGEVIGIVKKLVNQWL